MTSAWMVTLLLAAPPPLPECADADAMAWVHAPRAGASLAALARGGLADLAGLLLPEDVREALAAAPDAEMLAASYRNAAPGGADVILWLDAGDAAGASVAMMESWLGQLGFKQGERREREGVSLHTLNGAARDMTVFSAQGRCGWTSDVARAERALKRAEEPLASDASFKEMVARTSDADVRGRLDVQRFYGMLARSPAGPQLAGQIRRLGLDGARAVEMQARLRGKNRLLAELKLTLPKPWRDLPAALGPPIRHERPVLVPKGATGFARVSVKPADLWYVAEKLYGYQRAMESSLVRAQLDGIERRLGKSFTEDALGHEPRVWTTWSTNAGRTLVAEIADPKLAVTLLSAYAEVLPTFFPDFAVSREEAGGKQFLILKLRGRPLMAFASTESALVVAATRAQVESAMAPRGGKARVLGATPVVAHGEGLALAASLARFLPAVSLDRLLGQPASWQLRAVEDGFIVDAVARAR